MVERRGTEKKKRGRCGVEGFKQMVVHSPKTRVEEVHNKKRGIERRGERRERKKNSYFTPMQHAEEIQLPFKLHI